MRTALFTINPEYKATTAAAKFFYPAEILMPWMRNSGKRVVVVEEPDEDVSSSGNASHKVIFEGEDIEEGYYVDASELTDYEDVDSLTEIDPDVETELLQENEL